VVKVRKTLHALVDGVGGCTKELSSKWTLWRPGGLPVLFQVTVSFVKRETVAGENVLEEVAVTVWLAANAAGAPAHRANADASRTSILGSSLTPRPRLMVATSPCA
jgi:hypothetical protein